MAERTTAASGAATSRRHAVFWSAAFGYSGLALALARNIVLVPVYLHYIGLGEYGAWLATGGALLQLLLSDFGLAGVVSQRVAHEFGSGSYARLGSLIGSGLVNGAMLGLLLSAICLALAPFLPAKQGLTAVQEHRVLGCFLLAVCANGIGVFGSTAVGIVRSLQRAIATGTIVLLADLASIVATVGGLFAGLGLYSLPLGLLARSLAVAAGTVGYLGALQISREFLRPRLSWVESALLWRASAQFFLTSIAMKLQSNANLVFVGIVGGPHSAAIYGLTVRAHETVLVLNAQMNGAVGPSLAHMAGESQIGRFRALVLKLKPLTALVAALGMTVTVTINEPFVRLWVGQDLFAGQATSIAMGLAVCASAIAYVAYETLLARGEFSVIARTFAAASLLHVALLSVLLRFGLWGAPVALLITTLVWGFILWRRIVRAIEITRSQLLEVWREIAIIAGVAAVVSVVLMHSLPAALTWTGLCIAASVCALALFGALLLVRPSLRRLIHDELVLTRRALRARRDAYRS